MGDTEMLIYAVEKYPCLWDLKNEDYHNRDVTDLAWKEVCKEVICDFSSNNPTEKLNKCTDLKKKWTHIRDYFRKDLYKVKNTPTGSAAKKQKRYVYADMLHFLEPVFERRSSEGNYPDDSQEEVDSPNCLNVVQEETTIMKSPPPPPSIGSKRKDVPSQILIMLQKRDHTLVKMPADEDDDTKFLLSFRGEMKKMNDHQKVDFKIGMLQLVKKMNQTLYVSTSPSTSHSYSNSPMSSPSPNLPYPSTPFNSIPQPRPQYSFYDNQPKPYQNLINFQKSNQPVLTNIQSRDNSQQLGGAEDIDEPLETYLMLK